MHAKASTFLERLLISKILPDGEAKHWRMTEPFVFDSRLAEGVLTVTQADLDLTRRLILSGSPLPFPHTVLIIDYPDKLVSYLIEKADVGLLINIYEDFKDPKLNIAPYPFTLVFSDHATAQKFHNLDLKLHHTIAAKLRYRDLDGTELKNIVPVDLTKENALTFITSILIGGIGLQLYSDPKTDLFSLPYVAISVSDYFDKNSPMQVSFITECIKESAGTIRRLLGLLYLLNNSNIVGTVEEPKPKIIRLFNRKPLPWLRKHTVNLKVPHLVAESFGSKDKPEPTGRHLPWHTVKAHWFKTRRGDIDCKHIWNNDPASSIRQFCSCGAKRILRSYPNGKGDRSLGMVKKVYRVTP